MAPAPLTLEAELLKALGHAARLQVLEQLEHEETCVCDLISITGLEQSNLSQHLKLLRRYGLVETRREGTRILYRLANPTVVPLIALARQVVQTHLDRMAQLAASRQA